TLDEVKGRRPGELLSGPGTDKAVVARLDAACAAGEPFKDEVLNYSKSREPIWIELEVQLMHDERGTPTGFMALQLDITERKRVQRELAQKEALFRRIFEQAPVGISWMKGRQPRTRIVNSAHERITGVAGDR